MTVSSRHLAAVLTALLTVAALLVGPSSAANAVEGKPKKPKGLAVVVTGLPAGVAADVTLALPKKGSKGAKKAKKAGRTRAVTGSATYSGAKPGKYVVTARPVHTPAGIATPTLAEQRVKVGKKRKRVTVRVSYTTTAPPRGWRAVAAGEEHTCAIRNSGALWCWGSNRYGQLGDQAAVGAATPVATPVRVGLATDWVTLAAGGTHTCGVRSDRSLWCWGNNLSGQLGVPRDAGGTNLTAVPVKVGADDWASVSAGYLHTCATRVNGSLWCWGSNLYGQLGTTTNAGTGNPNPVPVKVGFDNWASVSGGNAHSCGTGVNGSLWCWGDNLYGQLGTTTTAGTLDPNPVPVKVGDDDWTSVSAGGLHTCGTRLDKSLRCWGNNYSGQLGETTTGPSTAVPVKVGSDSWGAVSGGGSHSCGTVVDGSLWCWGANRYGQLGTPAHAGTGNANVAPAKVGADDWASIELGGVHSCGLRTDASLWCWGRNEVGQLASTANVGTDAPVVTPVRIPETGY